jgi:hypothetical protein
VARLLGDVLATRSDIPHTPRPPDSSHEERVESAAWKVACQSVSSSTNQVREIFANKPDPVPSSSPWRRPGRTISQFLKDRGMEQGTIVNVRRLRTCSL